MGRFSRRKGARGEVSVIHLLRTIGIEAWSTRSTQAASARKWDLDWDGCKYGIEVKIGQSWTVPAAWRQAVRGCEGTDRAPVLIARRDRGEWQVWVRNGDLPWWFTRWPKLVDGAELMTTTAEAWLAWVKFKAQAPVVCAEAKGEVDDGR